MFEFFAWLKIFPEAFKIIFNGLGAGIVKAIQYWYWIMIPPSIFVVYMLLKALDEAGITDRFKAIVFSTLATVQFISVNCFPLIANLANMLSCINNA